MAAIKYWLWLSMLPKLDNQIKLALLEYFGEPENIYYSEQGEYLLVDGMTRQAAQALEDKSLDKVEQTLGDCDRLGLRIITIRDGDYPYRLRNIYNPPILLYAQGRMPQFDDEVAIAMVGSRKMSAYGREAGERLAFQLAGLGAIVVSGLAAVGDACAHQGALRAGGFTAAVIGGGHDIIYPMENRELYEDIAVRGVILSEYPPGTRHLSYHFPVRNRIISGLCQATVVIEAPIRSGTLITAGHALDQGRDVFALPGQVGDWHCAGSNRLLQEGAGMVTDVWDILSGYAGQYPHKIKKLRVREPKRFGGSEEPKPKKAAVKTAKPPETPAEEDCPILDLSGNNGLTDDQIQIVKALQDRTVQADDLVEATQIPARRVMSALTVLEIDRIVTQESGKRFSLAVKLRNA